MTTTDPLFLNQAEIAAVDARIAAIEGATGVEVVAAVIGKADAYPEVPWTAFAVGVSLAALATVVADTLRPDWAVVPATLLAAVTILGAGAVSALATVFIPSFARLFVRAPRCEVEVREYARSLFLERELFRTRERTGILILVSLFERRIELLPDTGFASAVTLADWDQVVRGMTTSLSDQRPAEALLAGLSAVSELLARRGFAARVRDANELPDQPIELKGA